MGSVLVINCGSSSLKFAVIDLVSEKEVLKGLAEKLGNDNEGVINISFNNEKISHLLDPANHQTALEFLQNQLDKWQLKQNIIAIGHRVVHGGEFFSQSVVIDENVINKIADCAVFAPLHNPAHLVGIEAAKKAFKDLPQVAVFDTAFHQQMPEKAFLYPLPYSYYQDWHIRKYGFHGTSCRYIADQLPKLLQKDCPKVVVCHLGNGGSVTAINCDHSVDTTMGITPLEGLVQGTRCGDIDPALPLLLAKQFNLSNDEIDKDLWKESGLLGLSQLSNDCRQLELAYEGNHQGAKRALEVYCYRLAKHIAAQMVGLNGADGLIFTGGIGENSSFIRQKTVEYLAFLGFFIDENQNEITIRGKSDLISASNSKPIWVIPTNEELVIAQDTAKLIENLG